MTKLRAKTITAIVNTIDVSACFHPKRLSSGATNTLHPYSVPSARFIDSPPATRHQRLIPPFDCIRLIYGISGFESKRSDINVEMAPTRADHLVGSAHAADRSLERTPRRILERLAGHKDRLLAHHARASHFFDLLHRVGNDPMPAEQLHLLRALVGDPYGVLEHPLVLKRLRVLCRVPGENLDADFVGDS